MICWGEFRVEQCHKRCQNCISGVQRYNFDGKTSTSKKNLKTFLDFEREFSAGLSIFHSTRPNKFQQNFISKHNFGWTLGKEKISF